jgi:2-polyprenyl-3-methyl-5-hydroxy-6-metoxy-1,4-benzoquinol methylase
MMRKYLIRGPIRTLDAGCGNGAFSFLSYKLGNSVLGIDLSPDNINRCLEFRGYKGIAASRVNFVRFNLYNLAELNEVFDQILCFETLEHIKDDRYILGNFAKLLKAGGILQLGVPNINCPFHYGEKISIIEDGTHMRKGYGYSMLKEMLASVGLEVIKEDSYGGILTRKFIVLLRRLQDAYLFGKLPNAVREAMRVAILLAFNPWTYLEIFLESEPMSIFVMARKKDN